MGITRNHQAEYTHWKAKEVKIIDGKAVQFSDVCIHTINVGGDVEDPEVVVGSHIWKWQQTEEGQFILAHAVTTPYWVKQTDYNTWGQQFKIMARLSEQDQTFWRLKWG